jgi:hypothetical protein
MLQSRDIGIDNLQCTGLLKLLLDNAGLQNIAACCIRRIGVLSMYVSSTHDPRSDVTLEEELLTPMELARALKVPVSWVYDHSRSSSRQRIPCIKVGKYLRFIWPEVEKWLSSLHQS